MPYTNPSDDVFPLLIEAQRLLNLNQEQLANLIGSSRRTVSRWWAHQSWPSNGQLHTIAREIFPLDARLAAAIAHEGGATLEALGLVAPAPTAAAPAPAPQAPGPPPRTFPPIALMVDSILHAAIQVARAQSGAPTEAEAVREVLRAAFSRARGLGLTVEEVDQALGVQVVGPGVRAVAPDKPSRAKGG